MGQAKEGKHQSGLLSKRDKIDASRFLYAEQRSRLSAANVTVADCESNLGFYQKSRGLVSMPSVGFPGMMPDPSWRSGINAEDETMPSLFGKPRNFRENMAARST